MHASTTRLPTCNPLFITIQINTHCQKRGFSPPSISRKTNNQANFKNTPSLHTVSKNTWWVLLLFSFGIPQHSDIKTQLLLTPQVPEIFYGAPVHADIISSHL